MREGLRSFSADVTRDATYAALLGMKATLDERLGEAPDWTEVSAGFEFLRGQEPAQAGTDAALLFVLPYLRRAGGETPSSAAIRAELVEQVRDRLAGLPAAELRTWIRELPAEAAFESFRRDPAAAAPERVLPSSSAGAPEARATEAPDPQAVRRESLHLGAIDRTALTAAIVASLGGVSDLVSILHRNQIDPAPFGIGSSSMLEVVTKIVESLATRQRLGDFVEAVAEWAPAGPLRRLLNRSAERVTVRAGDPVSAVILPGDKVFIDREVLRSWVRGLLSDSAEASKLLYVQGPAGCGKTMTGVFLRHVAEITHAFDCVELDLDLDLVAGRPETILARVFAALGWRGEAPARTLGVTIDRWLRGVVELLLGRAARHPRRVVLFFDSSGEPLAEELQEFLDLLAAGIARTPTHMAAVFVMSRPDRMGHGPIEQIGDFTAADLRGAIDGIVRQLGIPIAEQDLLNRVLVGLAPGDAYNSAVSRRLRGALAMLAANAGPVRVFVSGLKDESRRCFKPLADALERLAAKGYAIEVGGRWEAVPGPDFAREREIELERAEIVVLLLTNGYSASEFARRELELALARRNQDGCLVVPVHVDRGTYDPRLEELQSIRARRVGRCRRRLGRGGRGDRAVPRIGPLAAWLGA